MFNIIMDECIGEMKANRRNVVARLNMNGMGGAVVACLFADDTVICKMKRKLKVNARKNNLKGGK